MIRKYKIGDAKKVDVQKEQKLEAVLWADNFDDIIAYSLVDAKGKVLAVMGYRIVQDKAEGFAIIGKKIGNRMISFCRFVNRLIKIETKKRKIEKVFVTVKDSFFNAKRLAEMLGFVEVDRLDKFFNNEDYVLMLRKERSYGI
ncbi:MAG: hypothetical protein IKW39_03225 [Alphaproteobacteria bacterium]|nr:hypothetical protein [Alphaproteobacteria bacterium]